MDWADIVGNIGVICFITTYLLMEKGTLSHTSFTYLGFNLLGALLVIVSLLVHWNLSAFLLEAAWALISIYGIYKHVYRQGRQ